MTNVLETSNVGIDIQDISLSGDFTIEFNIYFEPGAEIAKADGAVSSGTTGNGQDINFFQGRPRLYDSNEGDIVVSTQVAEEGVWNHYAFVREGGVVRLYVNGVNDASSKTLTYLNEVTISELASSTVGALEGRIDEIRIWDIARPGAEILANATRTLDLSGGNPVGLQRYYRFDEDSSHIVDATGNAESGHDLHLPVGAAIVDDPTVFDTPVGDVGNFLNTTVVSSLSLPTDMAFLPDGRMLVIQKSGEVFIIEDPSVAGSAKSLYMDLSASIENSRESGLLNIVVDPDFDTNGYFYLLYTDLAEQRTSLSRFQHQENSGGATSTGDLSSETTLWREFDVYSQKDHQGGGLAVAYEPIDANDPSPYKIYITVGEEFSPENAQDLTHDDGKVHRINMTDGSVPTDNPFYDPIAAAAYTPWVNTETSISTNVANLELDPEGVITTIYSYGLRNPWRAEYDQTSNSLWIGEVGGNGRFATEDIHIAGSGVNLGWPLYEGYHPDPDDPGSPIYSYVHATAPGQDQLPQYGDAGASISGGIVYRGQQFPSEYKGVYFYGDWVRNWIRYIEVDYSSGSPEFVSDNHFLNATGQVLSFAEAPDGTLYYITTFQTGNAFTFEGAVNKVEYGFDNQAPAGEGILLDPGENSNLTAPHTVTFETDAYDPDGDTMTYIWSFGDGPDIDGDGIGDGATSTMRNPSYTYTEQGEYVVELIVTDSNGAQTVYTPKTITVGDAPVVTINTPVEEQTFRAGDTVTFTGSATDAQDGLLSGSDVFWSVVLNHNEHYHPEIAAVENTPSGYSFVIPSDGHDYFENVGYQVVLTAIDSDGLSTSHSVSIWPEESATTYDMPDVEGYQFTLDGLTFTGDQLRENLIGFNHVISVQESYNDAGFQWNFSHWEDAPSITSVTRTYVVPETDSTLRPIYTQGGPIGPVDAVNDSFTTDLPGLAGGSWITLSGNILSNDDNPTGDPFDLIRLDGFKVTGQAKSDSDFSSGSIKIWGDAGGQFQVHTDGTVEFRDRDGTFTGLAAGTSAITSITYAISDGDDSDTAVISLEIDAGGTPNTAPMGAGILLDPGEDEAAAAPHTVTFDADVSDAEGHTLSFLWDFGDGATSTEATPSHTYSEIGYFDVTLTVTDELGAQTVFSDVAIDVGNAPPVAMDDSQTLDVGFDPVANHLHILDNDSDPDGTLNMQMVEIVSGPSFGTVEIMDTEAELLARGLPAGHYGHAEYATTDANFVGTDSFTYRVQDNEGAWSNVATMNITVSDGPPVDAVNDSFTTDLPGLAGGSWITLSGNILSNDDSLLGDPFDLIRLDGYKVTGQAKSDSDFSSGSIKIWGNAGGQFQVHTDGTVEFRDRDGTFTGLAAGTSAITSITYAISDGDDSDTAVISLEIDAGGTPNTAPMGAGILLDPGEDEAAAAPHTVTFDADVSDAEGHTLSFLWDFGDGATSTEATPSHTYSEIGYFDVTLTVTDELGAQTVFSDVAIDVGNAPPVAMDDSQTLDVGFDPVANHLHILDNDSDPDGTLNMQMVEIVSGPSFGTVEIMDTEAELLARGLPAGHYGHAEYATTDANFVGTDSFTYRVQDNEGAWSNVATMNITVSDGTIPETNGGLRSTKKADGLDVTDFTISGDFSVEFWLRLEPDSIVNKNDSIFSAGDFDKTSSDDDATDGVFGNDLNFHAGKMRLYSSELADGNDVIIANTAVASDGSWNHFALTRQSDDFNIFLNGVLDASETAALNADIVIENLVMSVRGAALAGDIDELRFWDDARSATEISDNMNTAINPVDPDLVRYYQFDDETYVVDSTGAGESIGDLAWSALPEISWIDTDGFIFT